MVTSELYGNRHQSPKNQRISSYFIINRSIIRFMAWCFKKLDKLTMIQVMVFYLETLFMSWYFIRL
ncbi:hypothetical protein HanIR_Chr04g0188431 [Helianthus annuus]|nr:hypothetical protein HanIR_Chr04g0188431 [Helianthus annuus]